MSGKKKQIISVLIAAVLMFATVFVIPAEVNAATKYKCPGCNTTYTKKLTKKKKYSNSYVTRNYRKKKIRGEYLYKLANKCLLQQYNIGLNR